MHPFIRPALPGHKRTNRTKERQSGNKTPKWTESRLRCRGSTSGWSQVKWWLGSGCFSRTPPWFAVCSGCHGPGRRWRPPSVNWYVRGCASRLPSPCWRQSECEIEPIGSYWQWALREKREIEWRWKHVCNNAAAAVLTEAWLLERSWVRGMSFTG